MPTKKHGNAHPHKIELPSLLLHHSLQPTKFPSHFLILQISLSSNSTRSLLHFGQTNLLHIPYMCRSRDFTSHVLDPHVGLGGPFTGPLVHSRHVDATCTHSLSNFKSKHFSLPATDDHWFQP